MPGVMKDIEIHTRTIEIVPGNRILLFTDELTETVNSDGEPFEEKALADIMTNNPEINLKEYVYNIYDQLIDFRGSEKFDDDVCIPGIELL
jgi:serine phosphatase RsbU (regulator of sigma subunit)